MRGVIKGQRDIQRGIGSVTSFIALYAAQHMQHIHIRTHIHNRIQLPLRTRKSCPETLADTKFIYKHKKQDLSNATCVAVKATPEAA